MEQSRSVAVVRIRVERVIGVSRNKYSLLEGILPLVFLMKKDDNSYCTIDKIVYVACG